MAVLSPESLDVEIRSGDEVCALPCVFTLSVMLPLIDDESIFVERAILCLGHTDRLKSEYDAFKFLATYMFKYRPDSVYFFFVYTNRLITCVLRRER